jgi:hypothetical protein
MTFEFAERNGIKHNFNQRMSPLLKKDGPRAIYHCLKSRWTSEDLFMVSLKNFAGHTR